MCWFKVHNLNRWSRSQSRTMVLCPSRAEDEQHSKEAGQRARSGTEGKTSLKQLRQNVVHSAARQRSKLCRSMTYRAQSAVTRRWRARHPRIGQGAWPACGGVVGDGTASAVADRSAQFTAPSWQCHRGQKKIERTATQDWAPARPPTPPGAPQIRARGQGCVPGVGREGGCGRQSRMSGERQAVCARRDRRPEGWGGSHTRWTHT